MHGYNELSHLPMMIHLPGGERSGERVNTLTQNIDLMPTLLDYYGIDIPSSVSGHSLRGILEGREVSVRDAAIYGWHGKAVNITDGRYTYFKAPASIDNTPCYNYCAIPTTFTHYLGRENPDEVQMGRFFKHTTYPVYRIPVTTKESEIEPVRENLLFDIEKDYGQECPVKDEKLENIMLVKLIKAMKEANSPKEQFVRLGIQGHNE